MEKEKIRTLLVGKFIHQNISEFPHTFPDEGMIKATEYPVKNPFSKNKDLPFMGLIPKDVPYFDLPELDIRGEVTGKKMRIVFMDCIGNKNLGMATHVGGLIEKTREIETLRILVDYWHREWRNMAEKIGTSNIDELTRTKTLKVLDHVKEIRKRTGLSMDFFQNLKQSMKGK